ncbi:MAG: hypothetical protein Q9217_003049 [Psora testacea]
MVIFQNKIIYMPSMPPFSRSETIDDYAQACAPVVWKEKRIMTGDGVEIALAIGVAENEEANGEKEVLVLYFQGCGTPYVNVCTDVDMCIYSNGGSIPPRLPGLSLVLKALSASSQERTKYTIVALSYRGFWTSNGRTSEQGIKLDAAATLAWLAGAYPKVSTFILWGQSIGAGVATTAAAAYQIQANKGLARRGRSTGPKIDALILETPFTSVRMMLTAMYPQKWLPYRYLYPFLRNHWDSRQALEQIAKGSEKPRILILQCGEDEIVPSSHGEELEEICKAGNIAIERTIVKDALHHEALTKYQGRKAVTEFIRGLVTKG